MPLGKNTNNIEEEITSFIFQFIQYMNENIDIWFNKVRISC